VRKHFIVGTAGHVDHGKSTLIRALTGIETDRLPEEKARGLSIDLGFAHLQLPGDVVAGIVDVPGHERFLKNMLAGVGGYDLGMLIVDAQEGVMPQTREHVEILQLLDTPRGIVVVTKIDTVDPDFLELVEEDLKEFVAGTFLENAPVVRVSAKSGAGLEELKRQLGKILGSALPRSSQSQVRLPVDRAFLKAGFGTVVTGSLWSGTLRKGDRITLWPDNETHKVRGLQVHGNDCEEAVAGQRVAVNLSGVEAGSVKRGMTLATPDWLTPTQRLDVRLKASPRLPRAIRHRSRLRLYHGSSEVFGRILLLQGNELLAGQEGLAQLVIDEPMVILPGDRTVLRDFTSSYTLGGAVVVEPLAQPHRRHDEAALVEKLKLQESGSLEQRVLQELTGSVPKTVAQLASQLQIPQKDIDATLQALSQGGQAVRLSKGWLHYSEIEEVSDSILGLVAGLQNQAPWKAGWRKEELLKILNYDKPRLAEEVFGWIVAQEQLKEHKKLYCLPGHHPGLPPALHSLHQKLRESLHQAAFSPPSWSDVAAIENIEPASWRILETYMMDTGEVIRVAPDIHFLAELIELGHRKLGELEQPFTASQARDALQTSRKFAIPLLEYWDQNRYTLRNGELRTVRPNPLAG